MAKSGTYLETNQGHNSLSKAESLCENDPQGEYVMVTALLSLASILRSNLATSLSECDLNDARYAVLQALASTGPQGCSQTVLAKQLQNSESNISTLLDRMAADGLVCRCRCETDRRKSLIRLSDNGEALLSRANQIYQRSAQELLEGISPSYCKELTRHLERIRSNLDSGQVCASHDEHHNSKQINRLTSFSPSSLGAIAQ